MLTAFFMFNPKGDVLISKLFREGVKRSIADVFRIQVISNNDVRSPILTLGSTTFLHIKSNNIWLVAVLRSNVDASVVFESLYKLLHILSNKFPITESDIKLNFTLIYEILDEIFEFGYPQTTEANGFQLSSEPITSTSLVSAPPNKWIGRKSTILKRRNSSLTALLHGKASSEVPWRNTGIKYRKNEIYLDVYENVNLLMSANGTRLRSYVDGKIMLKTQLSGMPVCKIGLNELKDAGGESNVSLEDFKFHQCVDFKAYDQDKVITFVPPDGEFELMTYRSNENINLPFKVMPNFTESRTTNKLDIQILLQSMISKKLFANDVELIIPVPKGTIKTNADSTMGKLKFEPELNAIVWKINKFVGSTEASVKCSVELSNSSNILNWTKPPMLLKFSVNMYSCSGLNVRFLRIEGDNTKLVKWVKYVSQAGSYEIRY